MIQKMIRAYLAGPYSGDIDRNIQAAEAFSVELYKRGIAVFTPHKNTSHFEVYEDGKTITKQTWYDADMEWLRVSQIFLLMPNFKNSPGSLAELREAQQLCLDVYVLPELKDKIGWEYFDIWLEATKTFLIGEGA